MLTIPNPVSDLAGGVPKYDFFFKVNMYICRYSDINSDKIRTSPQPGARNAWIGDPHNRNCMVEVGTWSLPAKVQPQKNRNQKKFDGK